MMTKTMLKRAIVDGGCVAFFNNLLLHICCEIGVELPHFAYL